MKTVTKIIITIIFALSFAALFSACSSGTDAGFGLATPENVRVGERDVLYWDKVDGAAGYEVDIDGEIFLTDTESLDMFYIILDKYDHNIKVRALPEKSTRVPSLFSDAITYKLAPTVVGLSVQTTKDGKGVIINKNGEELPEKLIIPEMVDEKPVVEIKVNAFGGDTNVKVVVIPDNVEKIGYWAFRNCTSLKRVYLSQGVKELGDVFSGCTALDTVVLPQGLERIELGGFSDCTSLKSLYIPENVGVISGYIANNALERLTVDENNPTYCSKSDCILKVSDNSLVYTCRSSVVPSGVTEYGEYAFAGRADLESVVISDNVTKLGDNCFFECTGLKSVDLSENLLYLPERCFYGCSSLESIEMPAGMKGVGRYCFKQCVSLKSVKFSAAFEDLGSRAFEWCHGLEEISVDESNEKYYAENDCLIERGTKTIVQGSRSSVIPDSVQAIGSYAFCDLGLVEAIIPSNVKQISDYAFCYNTELNSIELSEGIETIGAQAFACCYDLKYVALPKTVKVIEMQAFYGCFCAVFLPKEIDIDEFEYGTFDACVVYTDRSSDNMPKQKTTYGDSHSSIDVVFCETKIDDGESYIFSIELKASLVILPVPYRKGYVFKGWATEPDGESIFEFAEFDWFINNVYMYKAQAAGPNKFYYDTLTCCGGNALDRENTLLYSDIVVYAIWEKL